MARKLDQTDQQILALLAENARQSVKELARRIGLSRSAAQERLARLERDGVLMLVAWVTGLATLIGFGFLSGGIAAHTTQWLQAVF